MGLTSWVTKYLKRPPEFGKKMKDTIPDLNAELEKKEKEKEKKLADLEAKKKTFEDKKENARSEIQKLESDLDKTSDGDYLSTFIKGRMGTDEYTKHLGLQANIRTDFEQLSNLIEKYNQSVLAGEVKDNDGYMINRIVLYIDDLDRCPPDTVVEVLQAVHLLLSFPAFVVVVAVDARWVSQSLRIGYKDLFGQDDSADIDGDGIPDSFRATPHDYLEKIFQIPFWLYPMNIEGRRNLLTQLMESNLESEPAKESNPLNDVNSNKIVVSERIMANSEAVNINANSDISKNISGLERKDSLNPALQNEIQTESKDASSNLTESD